MAGVVVIGAGPGIGLAVARRFARDGMPVAAIARSQATLDGVVAALAPTGVPVLGIPADAADETGLLAALAAANARFGPPGVLVYNAAVIRPDAPGELSARAHLDAWAVNVGGALIAAGAVLPAMAERGSGTFLLTGGMPEPKPAYVSLSLGKAGVRALTAILDAQYGPSGVHVATVTVDGAVAPGGPFDPDDIAEHYARLHGEPAGAWTRDVLYSGRTGEIRDGGVPVRSR
jgi:NAD(P)-dependent dehydrogenase (short-subunit alcohol dehydrogenase family)